AYRDCAERSPCGNDKRRIDLARANRYDRNFTPRDSRGCCAVALSMRMENCLADTDALVIPVGQDCGPMSADGAVGGRGFRIDDGAQTHTLDDAEYSAWRAIAGAPPTLDDLWNRKKAIAQIRRAGVRRARRAVDALIRAKLVWEVELFSNDLVLFAGLHR